MAEQPSQPSQPGQTSSIPQHAVPADPTTTWWKTALAAAGAVIAGAAVSWTGIQSKLDSHALDIAGIKVEVRHIGQQVDKLIDRSVKPPPKPEEKP